MRNPVSRILTGLAISGLIAFGILSPQAEMEPEDNTMGGAPDETATLLLAGQAVSGMISGNIGSGDVDYYKITNPGTVSKPLTVELSLFNTLAGEKAALTIFEDDGLTMIGGPLNTSPTGPASESDASLTVMPADFQAGETIIICVEGDSIGAPRNYSLSTRLYTPEVEANDTTGTATDLPIATLDGPPCFGQGAINNGENPDYWKLTNTDGYNDKLAVHFTHEGGESDEVRFRVLKDDMTEIFNGLANVNTNKSLLDFDIPKPTPGEVFYLCVEDETLTMEVPYTINVTGFNTPPAAAPAPAGNSAAIAAAERSCKKLRKKLKRAKGSKKRKIRKKLKKCKRKLRALRAL